jgi:hypothetical protein
MGPGKTRTYVPSEDWEYFFEPVDFPVMDGRIDGTSITFSQSVVRGAGSQPNELLKYTGKLSGDRITFTRETYQRPKDDFVIGDHRFEFTAVRTGKAATSPAESEERIPIVLQPPRWAAENSNQAPPRIFLLARVTNAKGESVNNLPQSDFVLLEDGIAQPIQNFLTADAPLSVLQLFDHNITWLKDNASRNSSGFGITEWNMLLQASAQFVDMLRPTDLIAMADFESTVHTALNWRNVQTNGPQPKISMGMSQPPTGQKDIYGAVKWAVKDFQASGGRKIALFFTDGRDGRLGARWLRSNRSKTSLPVFATDSVQEVLDPLFGLTDEAEADEFASLLNLISGSGVHCYFVAINSDRDPEFGPAMVGRRISGLFPGSNEAIDSYLTEVHTRMERLAANSGGRVFYGDRPEDAISIYESLPRNLGVGMYSFEMTPTQLRDGKTHRIEVRVKDPNLRVVQSVAGYQ